VICKREHAILAHPRDTKHPYEYYRLRYVEWERGRYPTVTRSFIPVQCVQCNDPICLRYCSVDAITRRKDGIIEIDRDRCNGCGVCTAVCPYGAVYIDHDNKADACDLCVSRLATGLEPACVEMCPADARVFGDLDDPESNISNVVKSGRAKSLVLSSAENNRIFYIPSSNEGDWKNLENDEVFQKALDKRRRDLPPLKGIL
jgi:tetrathionate reductase subunit B